MSFHSMIFLKTIRRSIAITTHFCQKFMFINIKVLFPIKMFSIKQSSPGRSNRSPTPPARKEERPYLETPSGPVKNFVGGLTLGCCDAESIGSKIFATEILRIFKILLYIKQKRKKETRSKHDWLKAHINKKTMIRHQSLKLLQITINLQQ